MTPDDYIAAARVPPSVVAQAFGLWTIERRDAPLDLPMGWQAGTTDYTLLWHVTPGTIHINPAAEVVMEDSPRELRRHLPIFLSARGRVLVTGLGLGCVVRGLLASPRVEHIDVVEIDPAICRVIGAEFERDRRVTLHNVDALAFRPPPGWRWDFAWHDLWCESDGLQRIHLKLMRRLHDRVGWQGAWGFPRWARKRHAGLFLDRRVP